MKKEMKKQNNKGFSLVELIVVIAIMAVLVGVLAPAYLRYVEKSRLNKDNDAIAEIAKSIQTAASEEEVYTEIGDGVTISISSSGVTGAGSSLDAELQKTLGTDYAKKNNITSKTYNGATIDLDVTISGDSVTVSTNNWIAKPGDNASTKTF